MHHAWVAENSATHFHAIFFTKVAENLATGKVKNWLEWLKIEPTIFT